MTTHSNLLTSRVARLAVAVALAAGVCGAQDANEILAKAGAAYQSMTSYHFEGKITSKTDMGGKSTESETQFVVAYASPDQFRVEFRYPTAGDWVRVSDGKTYTAYRSISKQLDQSPATSDSLRVLEGSPVASFDDLAEGRKNAKVVGTEPVMVDGKAVDCYVIEFDARPRNLPEGTSQLPTKVWVDKQRMIVLRRALKTQAGKGDHLTVNERTIEISSAQVNQPVAPTLFAFDRTRTQ